VDLAEAPDETALPPAGRAGESPAGFRIFAAFLGVGCALFLFTSFTVNFKSERELRAHQRAARVHFAVNYWDTHGYFQAGGLAVRLRTPPSTEPYFYRSSTGGYLLSAFVVQKIHRAFTGRYGWQAIAIHHQVISLISSALLGLLCHRIAIRCGSPPLHAFVLAAVTQVVFFTFPENLELYWEMSEMQWWILVVLLFLLFEDATSGDRTSRRVGFQRGLLVLVMAYLSVTTTPFFLAAWIAGRLIADGFFPGWRTFVATLLLPVALVLAILMVQRAVVDRLHPDVPVLGSSMMFRSGLDGSVSYYGDHKDLLYGRRTPARRAADPLEDSLRFPMLFVLGGLAILAIFVSFARGNSSARLPVFLVVAFGGTYALYAAIFSQSITVHPYLYDPILVLPFILALFTFVPSRLEVRTRRTGMFVLIVAFAGWIHAGSNLREYAKRYPAPSAQPAAVSRAGQTRAARKAAAAAPQEKGYGSWKVVPHAASNFSASSGEWIVEQSDQSALSYTYLGPKTMLVSFFIQDTDVKGNPVALRMAIPNGEVSRQATGAMCRVQNAGGDLTAGFVGVQKDKIIFQTLNAKPWSPTSKGKTVVFGSITFEIQ
jgi:hypothetical protein